MELREFPLQTQLGTFETEYDVEQWLLNNDEIGFPHDYAALIKASQIIVTPRVEEYLIRYKMQKQYNIYSYSQVLEEIPAEWVDMLSYMDFTVNEALEEKKRLGE